MTIFFLATKSNSSRLHVESLCCMIYYCNGLTSKPFLHVRTSGHCQQCFVDTTGTLAVMFILWLCWLGSINTPMVRVSHNRHQHGHNRQQHTYGEGQSPQASIHSPLQFSWTHVVNSSNVPAVSIKFCYYDIPSSRSFKWQASETSVCTVWFIIKYRMLWLLLKLHGCDGAIT